MTTQKGLITRIGEWFDERNTNDSDRLNKWSKWMPTPGNIIFTLVIVALLIFTQQTWANNTPDSVNAPGPSATTVNYQGRLASPDGTPKNGTFGMSFAIWDAASGGNVVWGAESHTAVPVTDGLFNVGLGSQTSGGIPTTVWNGDRYLEITVGGETLTPRELIRSVPIAGMALTVPDGAIGTGQIVNGSITKPKLASNLSLIQLQGGRQGGSNLTPGWTLHQGTGDRTYTTHITFNQAFTNMPTVLVSLSHIDADKQFNNRIVVYPTNVTPTGFDLNFNTFSDSLVYGATATWMAYANQ